MFAFLFLSHGRNVFSFNILLRKYLETYCFTELKLSVYLPRKCIYKMFTIIAGEEEKSEKKVGGSGGGRGFPYLRVSQLLLIKEKFIKF